MSWPAVLWWLIKREYQALRYGRDSKLWRVTRQMCINRQRGRCYITGQKCRTLDVHHLDDASTHPEKSLCVSNLVALRPDIHRRYHRDNGGTRQPCTAAHFKRWAKQVKKEYR